MARSESAASEDLHYRSGSSVAVPLDDLTLDLTRNQALQPGQLLAQTSRWTFFASPASDRSLFSRLQQRSSLVSDPRNCLRG